MVSLNGFDSSKVVPQQPGFEMVPEGKHLMRITSSKFESTKNGLGEMLVLTFECIEAPNVGKSYVERLLMKHTSEQAVKIAQSTLSCIAHAVGCNREIRDSQELHDLPMYVTIKHIPRQDRPDLMSAEAKKFESRADGYNSNQAQSQVQSSAPEEDSLGGRPSWMGKDV